MLFDAKLLFSSAQALTSTAATTIASTNDIDLGPLDALNTQRNIGAGDELWLVSRVTTTFASTGSATLTALLVSDDNSGFTSTALVASVTAALAASVLTAGYKVAEWRIPKNLTFERYLRMNYVVGTAPFSAGALTTMILSDVDSFRAYAQDYQNLF